MQRMSEQINELATALAFAQPKIRGAAKNAENPILKRRYADLASVWDSVREVIHEHGLSVVQLPVMVGPGVTDERGEEWPGMALDTILLHTSGQWVASRIVLHYGPEKALTPMQTLGKAITYARRYGIEAILGVCVGDDDGEGAGRRPQQQARPEPPKRSGTVTDPYIDRWAEFDPIRSDADRATRKDALIEALMNDGLASAKVSGADITTDGKPDRAKAIKAASRLWRDHNKWCREVFERFLAEAAKEKESGA